MFDFHDFISSWSHLLMAGLMIFAGLLMLRLARRHPRLNRLSVLFYTCTGVVLFTSSGLFHGVKHIGDDDRRFWQLCDQTAIFGLIYGSNVPLLVYFLPARRRNWLLILMGSIAVVGAMVLWTKPNHEALAVSYIAVGLLGLVPMRTYFRYLGWWGTMWVFIMTSTYILGAVCEAIHWPVIIDEGMMRFSYHEMLHMFVIAGTLAHVILLMKYVLPTANRRPAPQITVDRGVKTGHNCNVALGAIPPVMDRR